MTRRCGAAPLEQLAKEPRRSVAIPAELKQDVDDLAVFSQLHIVSVLTGIWIQRDGRLLHRRSPIQPGFVKKNCDWVTWIHALTSLPGHPGVTGMQVRVPS